MSMFVADAASDDESEHLSQVTNDDMPLVDPPATIATPPTSPVASPPASPVANPPHTPCRGDDGGDADGRRVRPRGPEFALGRPNSIFGSPRLFEQMGAVRDHGGGSVYLSPLDEVGVIITEIEDAIRGLNGKVIELATRFAASFSGGAIVANGESPEPIARADEDTFKTTVNTMMGAFAGLCMVVRPRYKDLQQEQRDALNDFVAVYDICQCAIMCMRGLACNWGARNMHPSLPLGRVGFNNFFDVWDGMKPTSKHRVFTGVKAMLTPFCIDSDGMLYLEKFVEYADDEGVESKQRCFFFEEHKTLKELLSTLAVDSMCDADLSYHLVNCGPQAIDSIIATIAEAKDSLSVRHLNTSPRFHCFPDGVLDLDVEGAVDFYPFNSPGIAAVPSNISGTQFHSADVGGHFAVFRARSADFMGTWNEDMHRDKGFGRDAPFDQAAELEAILQIETPHMDVILNTQKFPKFVRIMYFFMLGRMLNPLNSAQGDNYQRMPFHIGQGGTGKSTLLKVIDKWFAKRDVCKFQSHVQEEFALGPMGQAKRVWMVTEIQKDFNIPASLLWEVISGTDVLINEKHKRPYLERITAPGVGVGNLHPIALCDTRAAAFRRIMVFFYPEFPEYQDSHLEQRIEAEEAVICLKSALMYAAVKRIIDEHYGRSMDMFLKKRDTENYFFTTAVNMHSDACPVMRAVTTMIYDTGDLVTEQHQRFLQSRGRLPEDEERLLPAQKQSLYILQTELVSLIKTHVLVGNDSKTDVEASMDMFMSIFGLRVDRGSRPWEPNGRGEGVVMGGPFVMGMCSREHYSDKRSKWV